MRDSNSRHQVENLAGLATTPMEHGYAQGGIRTPVLRETVGDDRPDYTTRATMIQKEGFGR